MTEKQRKTKYWIFKILSIVVACCFPMLAVIEHFPLWRESYGTAKSIGAGGIICIIVAIIIFRKSVFNYLRDKMKLQHAPPLAVWLVLIVISYIMLYINQFIRDLTTVLWMGLVGCVIGNVLTYIAENKYGKKTEDRDGTA